MDHITEIHTTEGSKQDSYSVLFVCIDCFVVVMLSLSSSSSSMYSMSFIGVFVIFDSVFFFHASQACLLCVAMPEFTYLSPQIH